MATAKTAAKAKQNTVSLKHLAAELTEAHEVPKKQAEAMLNDLVVSITKHLKKGERIRLVGLGVLVVRKRAARMGRNPATGEPVKIKASKRLAFRQSAMMREAVSSRRPCPCCWPPRGWVWPSPLRRSSASARSPRPIRNSSIFSPGGMPQPWRRAPSTRGRRN